MKTRNLMLMVAACSAMLFTACSKDYPCGPPESGKVLDEAQCVGRLEDSLPGSDNDYLADMDYGLSHYPEEIRAALDPYFPGITADEAHTSFVRGRNNWNIWTAGNDVLWDKFATDGIMDLLKTVSNHPSLVYSRDNRWEYLGVVNEPCFSKGSGPREDRYGLWLDVRDPDCPPDPFEDASKYPGVEIGARGKNIDAGSYYGYASGVLGLRLLPNPNFDEAAQRAWDPKAYYEDPNYYNRRDLVRPYRVGMSCGFCHIGPNPSNPPADPENPTYANLNSNPGAQYFWIDRIFMWNQSDPDDYQTNFIWQLLHTSRPGALDTSLVSSDQINNPRTMNAVYNFGARAGIALKWGKERLSGGELNNKQFQDYSPPLPDDSVLMGLYEAPDTVLTPRVLKDGADSVGFLGALNRVFINIGLFSEEWTTHFIPLVGGANITPIPIATLQENSSYWRATEEQTIDTALFFLASAKPDYLSAAPGGDAYLTEDEAELTAGKEVFADTCARCHSSKLPEKAFTDYFPDKGCVNDNYLQCWDDYWQWTKTAEFKDAMRGIVLAEDFLADNYLSTELRIPSTLMETNACSPLATNAIEGDTWNDFSSTSYKNLPAVGEIQIQDPFTGEVKKYDMPGGGRGYTRPASLVSLWSTAPYLLNNTVGDTYTDFKWTGSVPDRIASFNGSIEKLLWPQKRGGDFTVVTKSGREHPGIIDRTTRASFLRLYTGFLPDFLQPLAGFLGRFLPWLASDQINIGPIPSGTPINLISNINLSSSKGDLLKLFLKIKKDLKALPQDASDEEATKVFSNVVPDLLAVSKCPDFVVNKGHYYGTEYLPGSENETPLTDDQKWALIEFLKTL